MSTRSHAAAYQALNTAEPSGANRIADSAFDRLHYIAEHLHTPSKVYPTLADGVSVSTGAGAWGLGSLTEIVPASTITDEFDVHWVSVESISASGVYELVLCYGASDTECGRVRFVKTVNQDGVLDVPIICSIIPANSRVRAQVASSTGGDSVTISLMYHTY